MCFAAGLEQEHLVATALAEAVSDRRARRPSADDNEVNRVLIHAFPVSSLRAPSSDALTYEPETSAGFVVSTTRTASDGAPEAEPKRRFRGPSPPLRAHKPSTGASHAPGGCQPRRCGIAGHCRRQRLGLQHGGMIDPALASPSRTGTRGDIAQSCSHDG